MALPTLVKTWQFAVNQTLASTGTLAGNDQQLLYTIKSLLTSFASSPWIVDSSSNAQQPAPAVFTGSAGAGDRWASPADCTRPVIGAEHGWIVLRQPGTGMQICIDLPTATNFSITLAVSYAAGFTGGTTTARPTATDEVILLNVHSYAYNGAAVQFQVHAMQSDDGECTRIQVWRGTTNQCTLWMFEKAQNPVPGWANPLMAFALDQSTAGITGTYAALMGARNFHCKNGAIDFAAACTGEIAPGSFGSVQLAEAAGIGTVANDFSGNWPMFKIGLGSDEAFCQDGHLGNFFDLWWKPTGLTDADITPANADFAVLGNLFFPWVGGGVVPLLT